MSDPNDELPISELDDEPDAVAELAGEESPIAEPIASPGHASASAGPQASANTLCGFYQQLVAEVGKAYIGQSEFVQGTLVALLSGGHVLIESVPGLGKTLLCRALAKALGCTFRRIQFTADLMPSDVTGSPVFDLREQKFQFRPGPIFTQLLLADEVNRSPAKTHAALLEVMQERRVTVDGITYDLEPPFLVLATQNPVESEGTYNLPEAQLDRFMFKVVVEYPTVQEEARILKMHQTSGSEEDLVTTIQPVANPQRILSAMNACAQVRVDEKIVDYINAIVRKTRKWPQFYMGASPRAGIALLKAARTLAACNGRSYVVPDDVVELCLPALRHRVILSPEAEVEGRAVDDMLRELIRTIEVPRL